MIECEVNELGQSINSEVDMWNYLDEMVLHTRERRGRLNDSWTKVRTRSEDQVEQGRTAPTTPPSS